MSAWQFTLFRIVSGAWLAVHFASLATRGIGPAWPAALLAVFALFFAAGRFRRIAAALLGAGSLFLLRPPAGDPAILHAGLLFLLCAFVPAGEPWSRGGSREKWFMPLGVHRAAWILMALGYAAAGAARLLSPEWSGDIMPWLPFGDSTPARGALFTPSPAFAAAASRCVSVAGLLFAPLALWRKSRPWIWLLMILLQGAFLLAIDASAPVSGMLLFHLFTFDPAWLPARTGKNPPLKLAFDGECLMCSRSIRFLAEEDATCSLRFLTLQSPAGKRMTGRSGEPALKTMLLESDDRLFKRSDSVLRTLDALGGHWRLLAFSGRLVPRPLRDAVYNFIATRRHTWFGKGDACALPSDALRKRLLDGTSTE